VNIVAAGSLAALLVSEATSIRRVPCPVSTLLSAKGDRA